jgi:hypothetical protein
MCIDQTQSSGKYHHLHVVSTDDGSVEFAVVGSAVLFINFMSPGSGFSEPVQDFSIPSRNVRSVTILENQ